MCMEEGALLLNEGTYTVFLNTKGKNDSEVSEALVKFLKFVSADLENSTDDFEDDFVRQLQESVQGIKRSREMGERFMIFQEMLREERAEGKAEGKLEATMENIFELLEELGPIPSKLCAKIRQEKDINVLKEYLRKAAHTTSIQQFQKEIL